MGISYLSYLKVTIICRYIFFLRFHTLRVFLYVPGNGTGSTDSNVRSIVHIVMFASTKFCVFGPIRRNIKR